MSWSIGTVYSKPWFWRKGNRVSTVSDTFTVIIGGDNDDDQTNLGNGSKVAAGDSSSATAATATAATKKEQRKKAKQTIANNRIKSTKYTILSFLPKNLLEQFRRIANFYFLVMTIIAIVIDSPVSPLTSLIPLVFVISVTAVKQGYEDFLRHKADNVVNRSFVTVIRNGMEMDIKCENILQGDLVKASRDCDVPCDLVLLKTSDPDGKCFITTANLDGETNLKTLFVPKGFPNDVSIDRIHRIGCIECEPPLADLYTFNGRLEIGPTFFWSQKQEPSFSDTLRRHRRTLPLTADHLLLRGSRIKNTEWAIGCAIYTGQNTKLAINSQVIRSKISSSEKFINKFLVFFLVILITLVTFCYIMKRLYDVRDSGHQAYIGAGVPTPAIAQFIQEYFSFLILFNYLIPISLYVTIELHKFIGSFFMEWDLDLYDAETNQQFIVNTSDLNEELGQVKLLFSDKTGTLTKNEMILQQCSINGKKYKILDGGIQEHDKSNVLKLQQYNREVLDFFQTLAVCHTVQVADKSSIDADDVESTYEIVDEASLVDFDQPDEMRRNLETRNNTIQNEINAEANLLTDDTQFDSPTVQPPQHPQHKRTESTASGRKISFNLERTVFPIGPARPKTLPAPFAVEMPAARDFTPKIPSPLTCAHPIRVDYKRTMSSSIKYDRQDRSKLGHRRTQSCTTPGSHIGQQQGRRNSELRKMQYNRSSSNIANSREYYAAPAYNEATLLERRESRRSSIRVQNIIEQMDYQASSPDEKALVEGCAKVGFLYTGETNSRLKIKLKYQRGHSTKTSTTSQVEFERLHTLEFTSDRKRMSTIIRDPFDQIWLYTKGAESHVLPLCRSSMVQDYLTKVTLAHIDEYASYGLRTLAVARRRLTAEELSEFSRELSAASSALVNRKTLVEEVQAKIERNLELLGATAVEDALQDNVKDTLVALRHAGIKVWVLTGDKIETALNIAKSCGHIPERARTYFITECKEESHAQQHLTLLEGEMLQNPFREYSLLIDGASLALMLKFCASRFRDVSVRCHAVLCCRLSPLQKCEVVQLMKSLPDEPITAAIGDGANDVSMIQEAHIGLGIVGKEGRQAARCGDYAFANFSMIKKILLVHGHFYTKRLSLLVLYFFYKNLVFMLIQVYFQANNRFSAETIYEPVFLTFYNVLYTSWPILILSLTEKAHSEAKLMSCPDLYQENTGYKHLTWKYFIAWIVLSVYHSLVVYFVGYIMWQENNAILSSPYTVDLFGYGTFMIHMVVFVVNLKLWLIARYQTIVFLASVFGSISVFVTSTLAHNFFYVWDGQMLYVYNHLIQSGAFWMSNLLIIVAALLPDYALMAFKMFDIKFRPPTANGWSQVFKKHQKKTFRRTSHLNSISESTYL